MLLVKASREVGLCSLPGLAVMFSSVTSPVNKCQKYQSSDTATEGQPTACAGCRYNLVVVHAGVLPGVALEQQQLATLTTMRDIAEAPDGR
jgi:hypothetical protein